MAIDRNADHLVKTTLMNNAGISAIGVEQLMGGQMLTDPKDREALQEYLRLLHLGGPLLKTKGCKFMGCGATVGRSIA